MAAAGIGRQGKRVFFLGGEDKKAYPLLLISSCPFAVSRPVISVKQYWNFFQYTPRESLPPNCLKLKEAQRSGCGRFQGG